MVVYELHDEDNMSQIAADIFAAQILRKPNSVLGFATGSSPLGLYKRLIEKHESGLLDFSKITTFNLDEYCGVERSNTQSYYRFMMENLFSHLNLGPENIHLPDGMSTDLEAECVEYERCIDESGGIDLQILGIGNNGHIGFNEPNSVFVDCTHVEQLKEDTREANKRFFSDISQVPHSAISMGIGTIMRARKIVLLGSKGKADIMQRMLTGPIDPMCPASILRLHRDVTIAYMA